MKSKAQVLYKDILAGEIYEDAEGDFFFTYDQSYLDSRGPAISFSLPKQKQAFQSRVMIGFFDGLLPEGWLLKMAGEIFKLNPLADRYDLLLKTCQDPIGAVSIHPVEEPAVERAERTELISEDLVDAKIGNSFGKCLYCYEEIDSKKTHHTACAQAFIGQDDLPAINLTTAVLKDLERANLKNHISIQGVQHKISLEQVGVDKDSRLVVTSYAGGYILKPRASAPHLPENEDLTMKLAEKFGLQVAKTSLVLLQNGELALLSSRFDRKKKEKFHSEDFGQILDQVVDKKYISSLEKVGKALERYCINNAPREQVLRLFELVVFSYVVGNSDLHLKNISVLSDPGPRLSPAYDLLSFEIYQEDFKERDEEESALAINGRKSKLRKIDFDALAESFGLSVKVRDYVYKNINSKKKDFYHTVDKSFLPQNKRLLFKELIKERLLFFNPD